MMELRQGRLCLLVLIGLILIAAQMSAALAQTDQNEVGELHVEGEGIELLTLQTAAGVRKTFNRPGPTLTLPAGDYSVDSVQLEGGCWTLPGQTFPELRVAVSPGAPATLTLGAPLRQMIKAHRQGATLILNYQLTGRGGEQYTVSRNREAAVPGFAVYRGDRKVASGQFEFG